MVGIDTTTANVTTGMKTPSSEANPSTICLFCLRVFDGLDANVAHMYKAHGFTIPRQERLQVDLEDLIMDLEAMINEDNQCICCFTQRRDGEAIRQHMLDKGHCVLDVENFESEFAEFYSSDEACEMNDESSDDEKAGEDSGFLRLDDNTARLPSGRIVASSAVPAHRKTRARPVQVSITTPPAAPSASSALDEARQELATSAREAKRTAALSTALTNMRASDRAALAHLTPTQQRAQLAVQQQHLGAADRAQREMNALVAQKSNRTKMKFFLPQIPKRKLGQHHMSLRA